MMESEGSFFISRPKSVMDIVFDPDLLMKSAPDYYGPRFDGIKELRDADDGTGHQGQEFRRIASFVNVPLLMAAKLQDPDLLTDKKKFYAFLDRNPEYLTYQRKWQGGEQPAVRAPKPMNLADMGLDYDGGPKTAEGWDPVEVPLAPVGEDSAGPVTDEPGGQP